MSWTFPTSVTGVNASAGITYPFLKVVVQEKPATWFMGLLGVKSMTVGASCTCGLPPGSGSPRWSFWTPPLRLFGLSGGAHIVITGGPQ